MRPSTKDCYALRQTTWGQGMENDTDTKTPTAESKTPRVRRKRGKPRRPKRAVARSSAEEGSSTGKGTPWTFPKNNLEDAIRVAKAIEDKNAGNPMPAPVVAMAVGFKQANDW